MKEAATAALKRRGTCPARVLLAVAQVLAEICDRRRAIFRRRCAARPAMRTGMAGRVKVSELSFSRILSHY